MFNVFNHRNSVEVVSWYNVVHADIGILIYSTIYDAVYCFSCKVSSAQNLVKSFSYYILCAGMTRPLRKNS